MRAHALPVVAFATAALSCANPDARTVAAWAPEIERVRSPAAVDSGQPQLSASDRGVLLSWIEKTGPRATLKFAERTSSGWTEARTIASGDNWFVNWADVPSALRLTDGSLAAHWLQKSAPDTYAYDVKLSFSRDEGRTWSTPITPHHDRTRTEHGFASLFQMPGAGLGLVWLDGRAMELEVEKPNETMSLRSAVFDPSGKQLSETLVDPRVCECCPTTVVVTADGPTAAYRNRSDDETRDIYISRLENGAWTDAKAVHADGWKIPACPVNGPVLSARGRDVAIAWFTAAGDQGRAFVAFSTNAGRTFGSPIRLDDAGTLGRVDVELIDDGSAVASWIEFADQRAQFRARRVERSGTRSSAITIAGVEGSRASGYPRLARDDDEIVFSWTESFEGKLRVQTAVARVAPGTQR